MDFKSILFGFILLSLFGVLILTTVTEQGTLYSKDLEEVSQGSLSLTSFNDSLSSFGETAQKDRESFSQSEGVFGAFTSVVVNITGFFDMIVGMFNMILAPFTLIGGIITNVFHVPSFIVNIIMGLLSLSLIFAVWMLIKTGQ